MSDYLPSFLVEPVLRQARRLSRMSTGEESPYFLPQVPDLQRWNLTRFWNTSPPPSIDEGEEDKETHVQALARTIQLWTNQINNLDLDIPSPPLEPMGDQPSIPQETSTTEFPPLEPEPSVPIRPAQRADYRTNSETSLNPARGLAHRSRALTDAVRGHAGSDPLAAINPAVSVDAFQRLHLDNDYSDNGFVRRRDGSDALPEDDGMGPLRKRINAIWAAEGTPEEKSRLLHTLMTARHRMTRPTPKAQSWKESNAIKRVDSPVSILSGASQVEVFNLTETDLIPSFAPLDADDIPENDESNAEPPKPHLGCVHYRRNVKMQCATCEKWYTCRLCHDDIETHLLPRRETRHMLCMLCNTPQQVGPLCRMCNEDAALYYCAICKLWNNDPNKSVYHCDDCGICRLGAGLGKDFFHCKKCAACMSIDAESTHRCIEKSTKCDCPICGEYLFTSSKAVAFMRCGHSIHDECFKEWCNNSYKCPICSKSIANMESQFRRLDRHIEEQPMPLEYRDTRAFIFCNDCISRSVTAYHWLGNKCGLCESYNTVLLEQMGSEQVPPEQEQQVQDAGAGEAGITASQSHTPTEELTQPAFGMTPIVPPTPPTQPVPVVTRSPRVNSPWLMPHSPERSVRSVSPVVESYFGTGQSIQEVRRGTPLEDDDDLDFWGARSPRSQDDMETGDPDDESSSDGLDAMEEDEPDDEEEDVMDILGHR